MNNIIVKTFIFFFIFLSSLTTIMAQEVSYKPQFKYWMENLYYDVFLTQYNQDINEIITFLLQITVNTSTIPNIHPYDTQPHNISLLYIISYFTLSFMYSFQIIQSLSINELINVDLIQIYEGIDFCKNLGRKTAIDYGVSLVNIIMEDMNIYNPQGYPNYHLLHDYLKYYYPDILEISVNRIINNDYKH